TVAAAGTALFQYHVESAGQRSEVRGVVSYPTYFAANRVDLVARLLAQVEHEGLHRVEIGAEARDALVSQTVEPTDAHRERPRGQDVYPALAKARQVPLHALDQQGVGTECFGANRPALSHRRPGAGA